MPKNNTYKHQDQKIRFRQTIASALLIVNKPSGKGRTAEELAALRQSFRHYFSPIAQRHFIMTEAHDQVIHYTRDFLKSSPGPWLLLSGGGGGTNRALVQGLLMEVENGTIRPEDVQVSSLRLGSGNLLPRYIGLPKEPIAALQQIAADISGQRRTSCCVYRCLFHYPNGQIQTSYGLTMGGIGQFGRVPDDIKHWRAKYTGLMQWLARWIPLEGINTAQYIIFSLIRAVKCLITPQSAEIIEINHAGRRDYLRLFSGILINFDFPQLPFRGGCTLDEPRLIFCLIPQRGPKQTLATLLHWPRLDRHIHKYEITPDQPLEIRFLERQETIVALDEDTFTAPNHLKFEVAPPINLVTGHRVSGAGVGP